MVSSVLNSGVAGASAMSARSAQQLMQSAGGAASGLFGTLQGRSTGISNTGLFNALSGKAGGTQSIDSLLQEQKVTTSRNGIFAEVAQRLAYIQQGAYQPKEDWEKIAGYAMQKGQPVMAYINDSGSVSADLQYNTDLSKFNTQQQERLLQAMQDIDLMAQKILANKTNDTWVSNLQGAPIDLEYVYNNVITPQDETPNNWEQRGVMFMRMHRPIEISLDAEGNLQVIEQSAADMSDLPYASQAKLREAARSVSDAIANSNFTESWQIEAAALADAGKPYHLTIDIYSNQISVEAITSDTIVPDFLKKSPYPDVGDNTDSLKQIAELIRDGKPYFLDIDPTTQQVVGKELTGPNLIKYNAQNKDDPSATLGVGSILSLFA